MAEPIDWDLTTFEGLRRRQHQEFARLPLRRKIALIEEGGAVTAFFASCRAARGLPTSPPTPPPHTKDA